MIFKKKYALLSLVLFLVTLLITIGLIFIYSSSSVYALERCGGSAYYVKRQLVGICLGLIGMSVGILFPLSFIKKCSPLFFFGSLGLTFATFFCGITMHGAHRWLSIGGISFQPSELLKISFLLYSSYFLAKKGARVSSFWESFVPYILIIIITSVVLLIQPDFGQAVVIATTGLLVFFIAGCSSVHLGYIAGAVAPIVTALIAYKPYRLQRVITFLDPWRDPRGSGFQIIQSFIAIGSGSWYGLGIGNSKQKFFYLPMQHTDFIFSIIAEETGFLGSIVLVILYILLLYSGIKVALQIQDPFSYFLILNFFFMINLQALINLCVAVGLLPTKGIGLPFVSYGISSLFCFLCLLGVIINAVRTQENR